MIALNKSFFNKSDVYSDEIFFSIGALAKVAIYSNWATFEDGTSISRELSTKLSSYITMHEDFFLGPNSNIEKIVKIGDRVKASDPILIVEKSFQDESINKVLSKLGKDFDQTIDELSKNVFKSKYSGEIVDIEISYNVPFETLSPSLQKLVNSFKVVNNKKKKYLKDTLKGLSPSELDKYYRINGVFRELEPLKSNKLKSKEREGIVIEFFIKTLQEVSVGNKIALGVAVKSIVSEVVENDKCPVTEYNKDEKVDVLVSPFSPVNRQTCDFFYQMCCNKVLLELKRKVKKILDE